MPISRETFLSEILQKVQLESEKVLTFPELARRLPRRRRGRPVATSTIHRWRYPGLRGVRLEAVRIGGAWATTWAAFERFTAALTALETTGKITATSDDTAHNEAADALSREGW